MAAQSNPHKVFVVVPEIYEDGLSVLSWVLSYFSKDKTKIIITQIVASPFKEGSFDPKFLLFERDLIYLVLNKYISHCATYKFQVEKLVHMADNIAEGIVQVIAQHGANNLVMCSRKDNLVMRSAADRDMTDETANKVMQKANRSCKLWFVSAGKLVFTREVNSGNLTPAPASEARSNRNGRPTEASSSTSVRSNNVSTTEEMLQEASKEADNFEKMTPEIVAAHKKITNLVKKLSKNLQMEKQEKDKLKREIQQVKEENDLLKRQRDEYLNQIQVSNERRLALERKVSDSEIVIKDLKLISASTGDHNNSLQKEKDNLVRKVKELSNSSSISLNSEFSLQELQQGTRDFSETLKIGEGGFGRVFKGSLRQTTVAIKLLHSQSLQGIAQFKREITILTKVRHPNLVTLIGACSDVSALVYEYLSNGSLEDRLTCANNTPPLTWQARTRIIGEICLALIFLHSNKPELVVHGDLKPGNILLDTNLVSKLSDFGISRLLKQPDTNSTAFFQTYHPAGTFAYIDPEYLSTGMLTPKSDTYSFGIIILQLLTGKSPMYIAKQVQDAMRNGILLSVIDEKAGTWPFEQATELAKIALRCAELSRSLRPDLVNEVWAVVEPLMKAASTCVESQSRGSELGEESIPSHFICPINQEVMKNPHIAADGFTYEADAIKKWLSRGHNTSPMTNLPLPHHDLIPNRVLHSAIQEWLQKHPQSIYHTVSSF